MPSNIILSSEEIVICPKCSSKFPVIQGITRQTIEEYEKDFDKILLERTKNLEEELSQKADKTYRSTITELKEEMKQKDEALLEFQEQNKKIKKETEEKIRQDIREEFKALELELAEKKDTIKDFRMKEIELRKDKTKLEEDKQNFELEQQRKLDEAKVQIEDKVTQTIAERFKFKEEEYIKQLESARRANEELTRKLDQGSQQLRGEVLELELESLLRDSFKYDEIQEVAKGIRGADVLQCVFTKTGQKCGLIIWEAKRAQNWSDKWLQKIKDDSINSNADIAIIVTTELPPGCEDLFRIIDGVWVVSNRIIRPVAETLREMLIQKNNIRVQNEGNTRKADLIYAYLSTPQFVQNLSAVIDSYDAMKQDLETEKRAMVKNWKKREMQLDRIVGSMTNIVAPISAIAQGSLPQLDQMEQFMLPGDSQGETLEEK